MVKVDLRGTLPPGLATAPSNPLREAREQLEQAETLRHERKFDRAETVCSALVRRHPDYFGALHTMGLICADKGDHRRALGYLVQAAMLNPRGWMTYTALAGVYLELGAREMAAQTLEQARAIKPNEPATLVTLGEVYSAEREYELARVAYREALDIEPGMEEAAVGLAQACGALGQHAEATAALDTLTRRGVNSIRVLAARADLPAKYIGRDVLAELDTVVQRETKTDSQFQTDAAFIRATALHNAGRHAEAWEQALAANRPIAATMKADLARFTSEQQHHLKWLQENSVTVKPSAVSDEKQPISLFILGPSRSGKTTMESLVATLDGLRRGYENPCVENAISRTYQSSGLLTTFTLTHLPPQFTAQVREIYAEELKRRAGSARVFTNTHPAYINECARLAATIPNVRIIFVKRNTEDLVLRIFMRKFRRGNAYSYDLRAAREHVVWYHKMMDLVASKLPSITRIISYEDMVADPTAALRVAADLCGLSMPQAALPTIGDDRGCASPYRPFMDQVFSQHP